MENKNNIKQQYFIKLACDEIDLSLKKIIVNTNDIVCKWYVKFILPKNTYNLTVDSIRTIIGKYPKYNINIIDRGSGNYIFVIKLTVISLKEYINPIINKYIEQLANSDKKYAITMIQCNKDYKYVSNLLKIIDFDYTGYKINFRQECFTKIFIIIEKIDEIDNNCAIL